MFKKASVILLNLAFLGCALWFFDRETLYFCGSLDEKPVLSLGLSPTWFDGTFQLNRGYKEIISNRRVESPTHSDWIKGREILRQLEAYDSMANDNGLLLRGTTWEDAQDVFLLREYLPKGNENHIYELVRVEDSERQPHQKFSSNPSWRKIDRGTCRRGMSFFILAFLGLFTLLADVYFLLVRLSKRKTK